MKDLQYKSFLMGIIVYLMYKSIFYLLFSLNDVLLFNSNFNEKIYILGLAISAVLTNGVIFLFYTYFVKADINLKRIIAALLTLSAIIVISMGINYYLAHFDYSTVLEEEYSNLEIYKEFYETKEMIYVSNSVLLMIVLLIDMQKKRNI